MVQPYEVEDIATEQFIWVNPHEFWLWSEVHKLLIFSTFQENSITLNFWMGPPWFGEIFHPNIVRKYALQFYKIFMSYVRWLDQMYIVFFNLSFW